jgi:hypothetical protein
MQTSRLEAGSIVDRMTADDLITQKMVDAATRLYGSALFRGWHISNKALEKLSTDLSKPRVTKACVY